MNETNANRLASVTWQAPGTEAVRYRGYYQKEGYTRESGLDTTQQVAYYSPSPYPLLRQADTALRAGSS